MRSKIAILAISTLAAIASMPVHAEPAVTVKSEVVRYGDLRLISAVGAAVLYARLRAAAERVCGGPLEGRPVGQATRIRNCIDDTLAKAVADVNQPVMTQYYESRLARNNGTSPPATAPVADAR
jgi:UrcA family protein